MESFTGELTLEQNSEELYKTRHRTLQREGRFDYFVLQFLKRCFTLQVTNVSRVDRSFFVFSYLSLI